MRIKSCGRCSLWKDPDHCVGGYGNMKSGRMIIAESPGRMEVHANLDDEDRHPMIAETGAILDWALRKCGAIDKASQRSEYSYVTNAVKCFPGTSDDRLKEGEDINTEHKKKCRYWLNMEIDRVEPKFVLVLGAAALHSVSGEYQASIMEKRGFWYKSSDGFWYMPTVHPAEVFRNPDDTTGFLRHVRHFVDATQGKFTPPKVGSNYRILQGLDDVDALGEKLCTDVKRLTFDFETSSVKHWDRTKKPLGVGFCWEEGSAAYIPLYGVGCADIWSSSDLRQVWKIIKRIMETPHVVKDGQNLKFDVLWARREGIDVRNIGVDTMQFHQLVDETTPSNNNFLITYYGINFPKYDEKIKPYIREYKGEKTYQFIPTKLLGEYCCADVDSGFRISYIQRTKYWSERRANLYKTKCEPLSKFTCDMEERGVLIDVDKIDLMEAEYQKKIDKQERDLSALVGMDYFNTGSPPQMRKVLFGKEQGCLGLKQVGKTKKGNPATDKSAFEFLRRAYSDKKRVMKVLNSISEVRKMKKMKSTYLTGFKKLVDENNRIHTSYLTTGTVTGRLASVNPNLQNIPRDPIFRSLFIAGKGRKLLPADYSQIEYRMAAWLAMQVDLIQKFQDPEFDPHTYNSSIVRGKPMSEVTKEERSYDKAVTFGIQYGRSAKAIADTYDIPLDFVKNFIRDYFKTNDKMYKWRQRQVRDSKEDYYIESKSGRRRHFAAYQWINSKEMDRVGAMKDRLGESSFALMMVMGGLERQAINFPIQSYSWDVMIEATDKLRTAIKEQELDAYLVLTVHDMLAIEFDAKIEKQVTKLVDECMPTKMEKVDKRTGEIIVMEFPVDYEVSDCWVQ
jgi:DNA polymerase I